MCVRIPANRCSIQILMHEINHYQINVAVVRCDYGSSFLCSFPGHKDSRPDNLESLR